MFSFRIKPERLKFLSLLIKSAFPTETEFTYYVPYANDSILNKKTLAKGKLRDRYNFYRGFLLESGATTRDRKSGKNEKRKDDSRLLRLGFRENLVAPNDDADAFDDKIDWLKKNIDPHEKVKQFWKDTSKKRILQLIQDDSNTSYFSDFVVLRHVLLGPELV